MANEEMGTCIVIVAGVKYDNMISLSLKRTKKDMTSSGTMVLSWPGAELFNATAMPAQELVDGARGEIMLDGQLAATIRIDNRTSHGSPTSFRLELSFRGLASAIVDSSADHPTGQENKKTPGQISKKLMEGYEPQLEDKSGESQQLEKFVIQEGETIERSIRRAGREFGLLATENEKGNVELQKKGSNEGSGQPLVLGRNFMEWSVKRDMSPRYSKVKAKGNSVPTDKKYGKEAEEVAGEAIDNYVKYKRQLNILIDSDHSKDTLKKRAVSEANRRKGQGLDVTLTMSTWSDDSGQLWKVGKLHTVVIPVDQVADQLLVDSVTFNLDVNKRETQVILVSPETYSDDSSGGGKGGGGSGADSGAAAAGGSAGGSTNSIFAPSVSSVVDGT